MPIESGSNTLSQELFVYLSDDLSVSFPPIPDLSGLDYSVPVEIGNPLYNNITKIQTEELTTGVIGGTGVFDKMMTTFKAHLANEHAAGRITGDQYTKAYMDAAGRSMEIGVTFLLNREQNYWQSLMIQAQAQRAEIERVTARVLLETAKITLEQTHAKIEAEIKLSAAQYALTKMQLATADQDFILKDIQKDVGLQEVLLKTAQNVAANYTNENILPAQKTLVTEQGEAQRAQTLNNRSDGGTVTGSVGKQKELYSQQIDSYIKEAQYKVAKMLTDGWITRKTLDENAPTPLQLTDPYVDEVVAILRTTNDL